MLLLEGSFYLIGGKSIYVVFFGYCGFLEVKLFIDLFKLKKGD